MPEASHAYCCGGVVPALVQTRSCAQAPAHADVDGSAGVDAPPRVTRSWCVPWAQVYGP